MSLIILKLLNLACSGSNLMISPHCISLLSEKGNGIEAYFYKRRLYFRTNQTNKMQINYNFETNLWYHVTVVHSYR